MFGQGFNYGFLGKPLCFTDTTDIFKDNSGVALYTLDYDASSGRDFTTNTLQILGDTSCIATYPLDGSSTDLSGNYSGTDTNITYTSGYFGQSASFNGSSSFITLPGNMLNSRTAISASAWVYRRTGSSDSYEYVIAGGDNVSGGRYGIAVNDAGSGSTDNKFYLSDGAASYHTNTVCAYNTWYHVVITWAGTEMKFYVNGSLDSTFTAASCNFQSSGNGHKIGEYFYNGNYEWEGEIDQVRLFNKAISASEVTKLYNEIGERNGTPTNVDFGVGGKSLYGARFNGSSSRVDLPNSFGITDSANFSASLWFNSNSTANQALLWANGSGAVGRFGIGINNSSYGGAGAVYFGCGLSSFTYINSSGGTFSQGDWVHVAVAKSSTTGMTLYVNGTQVANNSSATGNASNTATGSNTIGVYKTGSYSSWYNGSIDQVRIFSKALSSTEVSKLYGNGAGEIACAYASTTNNIALPITNTAYYKLDNDSKDSARSTGKFNEGAIFNGSSSKITLPSIPGLPSNSNNTNDFTFSCWVRSTTTRLNNGGGSNPIFQNYVGSYQFIGFGGNDNANFPTGRLFYYTYGGSGYHNSWITTSNSYADGQWHHVVVTDKYNSGTDNRTRTIYVDGIQRDQDTVDKHFNNQTETNPTIGDSTGSGNRHLGADLDQIRIYDTVLSSTDVSNLYAETASDTNTLSFPSGKTAIATYQLDGNSTDLSGNYNGIDTNVTYAYDATTTNVSYEFGRFGQAAHFSSGTFLTSSFASLSQVTVSFWVKMTDVNTTRAWFVARYGTNREFAVYSYDNQFVASIYYNGNNGNATVLTTSDYFNDNTWHHIVYTANGSTSPKLYIDGVETGTAQYSDAARCAYYTSSEPFNMGYSRTSSAYNSWDGRLDQVRIFSSALDSDQVTKLYNEKPEADTSNFKAVLWDGNGSSQYISNVGFQPDLVWVKGRGAATSNNLFDSIRGNKRIISNTTGAQVDLIPYEPFGLPSFEENGFYIGDNYNGDYGLNGNPSGTYGSSSGYVAWVWKGGGDAVSNTQGTNITSSVSANTAAGFSIVKWTGDANSSSTIGHGLTPNSQPVLVIMKDLDSSNDWMVITNNLWSNPTAYYLKLNLSAGLGTGTGTPYLVNNTVFKNTNRNTNGNDYIAYCWHSVAGYSKIGTYSGTSSTGNRIYVDSNNDGTGTGGFEPSFVMLKKTNGTGNWFIYDNKRANTNYLRPDLNNARGTDGGVVFTSDGFTINVTYSDHNISGGTYLYMAFK